MICAWTRGSPWSARGWRCRWWRPGGQLEERSQLALAQVPHAAQWARGFTRDVSVAPKAFRRRCAPYIVHAAVEGIALACIPEPDEILRELLVSAIGVCAAWARQHAGGGIARPTVGRTLTGVAIADADAAR